MERGRECVRPETQIQTLWRLPCRYPADARHVTKPLPEPQSGNLRCFKNKMPLFHYCVVVVLLNGIVAVGDYRGRMYEGTRELCCNMRSHAPSHLIRVQGLLLPQNTTLSVLLAVVWLSSFLP